MIRILALFFLASFSVFSNDWEVPSDSQERREQAEQDADDLAVLSDDLRCLYQAGHHRVVPDRMDVYCNDGQSSSQNTVLVQEQDDDINPVGQLIPGIGFRPLNGAILRDDILLDQIRLRQMRRVGRAGFPPNFREQVRLRGGRQFEVTRHVQRRTRAALARALSDCSR